MCSETKNNKSVRNKMIQYLFCSCTPRCVNATLMPNDFAVTCRSYRSDRTVNYKTSQMFFFLRFVVLHFVFTLGSGRPCVFLARSSGGERPGPGDAVPRGFRHEPCPGLRAEPDGVGRRALPAAAAAAPGIQRAGRFETAVGRALPGGCRQSALGRATHGGASPPHTYNAQL